MRASTFCAKFFDFLKCMAYPHG